MEKSKKTVIIYSTFFISMTSLFFTLQFFISDDPFQKVIIAPLGEEPLKFLVPSIVYLCLLIIFYTKKIDFKPDLSEFATYLISFSFLIGFLIGISEFIGGYEKNGIGSLKNLIGHPSYALIAAVPIAFWLKEVKYPYKYIGFLFIGVSMFFHSVYNQYSNISVVTERNSYLVSIAKFLRENTLLKTQWNFTMLIFFIALGLIVAYLIDVARVSQ